MERVFYELVQEKAEAGRPATYAIAAHLNGEATPVKILRDVSPDMKKVAKLVFILNLTSFPTAYLEYTVKSLLDL